MGKFDDIPVFSKFADLPEPYAGKFSDAEEYVFLTVAWVIEMYIRAMNGFEDERAIKKLGASHEYNLRLTAAGSERIMGRSDPRERQYGERLLTNFHMEIGQCPK